MNRPPPSLRHIKDRSEITFLWIVDYWDFPRSGVCIYEDRPHWFYYVEKYSGEPDWKECGWYQLCEISDKEFEDEKYCHDMFVAYVSDRSTFVDGEMKTKKDSDLRPGYLHCEFYDNPDVERIQKSQNSRHERPPVAWFE